MIRMKRLLTVTFSRVVLFTLVASLAASAQAVPQTARQALLEMFFSKTPGTFEKHLPQAMRAAMRKSGAAPGTSMLGAFAAITSQLNARGQQLQTFEAGPTLMLIEDPQAHSKFEITVDRDDLRGDQDEIGLSFHGSKDGETQTAGAKFQFTLTMKQEAGSWQLNEVMVAVGVSLTDPEFLKALATPRKPMMTSIGTSEMSSSGSPTLTATSAMSATNESSAVGGVRTINTAEVTYAAAFPGHGFTCVLTDLGGMGSGSGPSEHQAMLIDPRLSSGRKNGYVFQLTGCNGTTPAIRYKVSAVPADANSGTRSFCSDESAVIRFSADGKAESCLSEGTPLQ
jgi:hypothetical protein